MASRYWVGGTATWNTVNTALWSATSGGASGASVPTIADDVFFDAASGTVTVSLNTPALVAKSINCTGFTGTLQGISTANVMTVAGSITLASTMNQSAANTFKITGTGTIICAGEGFNTVEIDGSGITVTLGDAYDATRTYLIRGTFTTSASNYSITGRTIYSTGSLTRVLTLNGSTVTLNAAGVTAPAIDFTTTGLTVNAGTSTINLSGTSAIFNGAGKTFNNVTFQSTSVTTSSKINGANTFSNLTLTAPSASDISEYVFDSNQTITTFVATGASAVRRLFLYSDTVGTRRTLTVTTWSSITDVDFRDIGMNSSRSGTRLGNCGNNNNVTFAAAKTVYWNLTGTRNWSDTGWATTSGGTPAVNNFPLAQDTAVFNDAGAATTVSFNQPWNIGTLNMSARTIAMTLSGSGSVAVYGDWTCGTGVTQSLGNFTYFQGIGTQTITSAGQSFFTIACQNPSGTVSLADAFTTTGTTTGITVASATFNANTFSVTTAVVSTSSATIGRGTGTWTVSGTGNCWNCQSAVVTGTGEIILSNNTTTARTFLAAASAVYGKLTIGGNTSTSTTTITGSGITFSEIASTKTVAHTIVFPNTTITVGAFNVQGSAGNVVTLSRTGASGTFTLAKSGGGVVGSNFLSISNSTASPSNTWYAGANSTDGGGNTGWIFADAPAAGGGNFLAFFM
jgi:hypothetical protein